MKVLSRICIVLLYLPALWVTGSGGSLSLGDIRKNSLFATAVVIAYWLVLAAAVVIITMAYLGK